LAPQLSQSRWRRRKGGVNSIGKGTSLMPRCDLTDVLIAIAAQLRALKRELPATPAPDRDDLAREIAASEQLLERFARDARKAPRRPRRMLH
jgi:hypothetical protein